MKPIISLIIATYGRYTSLDALLESLSLQEISKDDMEVIVLDQNNNVDISDIMDRFKNTLSITWIKNKRKGLSINRNIGIQLASGRYIAFPDDDCTYYDNTISKVIACFKRYMDADVVVGRVYDRQADKNIMKYWSKKPKRLNRLNCYWNSASFVIFTKRNARMFDEKLGVGQYYGSCEDTDWVYSSLKDGLQTLYLPEIEVWHPEPGKVDPVRTRSYSIGFGGFCRKNLDMPILFLFFTLLVFNFGRSILNFFLNDRAGMKIALCACYWKLKGFLEWPDCPSAQPPKRERL